MQDKGLILNQNKEILLYQPVLQSIAFKMVGSLHDAEDIVQDTFLKWLTLEQEKISNTKAYLVKAVTNNCINHLNNIKKKKGQFLDTINPGGFLDKLRASEPPKFDVETEVSNALAVLHKKLEPLEKAIYVLREVFNLEYEELQEIFGKKKENCRQLFCRAKEKLNHETKKFRLDMEKHARFMDSFQVACSMGQISDLINEFTQEISSKFQKAK